MFNKFFFPIVNTCLRCEDTAQQKLRFPSPTRTNRACLVGVYAVTLDPLLSLYGIIYVTWYTRHLPKATGVRFR